MQVLTIIALKMVFAGCTTTTDDNLNDEVDSLLDTINQMSGDANDGYFHKVGL